MNTGILLVGDDGLPRRRHVAARNAGGGACSFIEKSTYLPAPRWRPRARSLRVPRPLRGASSAASEGLRALDWGSPLRHPSGNFNTEANRGRSTCVDCPFAKAFRCMNLPPQLASQRTETPARGVSLQAPGCRMPRACPCILPPILAAVNHLPLPAFEPSHRDCDRPVSRVRFSGYHGASARPIAAKPTRL